MSKQENILQIFRDKPYTLRMGANNLAKRYPFTAQEIRDARKVYHNNKPIVRKGIRILILDIETSPLKAYVWSRWRQNIYLEQTIAEWFMLTWSAKWLGESTIYSDRLNAKEVSKENDKRIVLRLWNLINEADVVIAHNGKSFDIPKMNARFILNGLPPTTPYTQIDTKEVAAKEFRFSSNKLDALAGYFGIRHKDDTDFELWARCMEGDEKALEYMEKYNRGDVEILELVYKRLRPYIRNHPNTGLYVEEADPVCPTCGSKHLDFVSSGFTFTSTSKFQVIRCLDCGALSKARQNAFPVEKRKNLIKGI